MADVESGKITVIVCRDDDRLVRQPVERERIINTLELRAVPVYFTHGSAVDLTASDGRFNARLLGALARKEMEKKSQRQKTGNRHRAAEGLPYPIVRPFGYIKDGKTIRVIDEEADAIRWAADRIIAAVPSAVHDG